MRISLARHVLFGPTMMNLDSFPTPPLRDRDVFMKARLDRLAGELIRTTLRHVPGAREGTVMSPGPKPYRRIDCDGRALAYVRSRPRKGAVRIDVSGLWAVPRSHPLWRATASGAATLFLERAEDLDAAVSFLAETIRMTREAEAAQRARKRHVRAVD